VRKSYKMEEVIEMFVGVILSKYYRVVVELIKEVCCESEGDLGSQQGKTFAGLPIGFRFVLGA
jgi:hypothetical protein